MERGECCNFAISKPDDKYGEENKRNEGDFALEGMCWHKNINIE